MYERVQTPTTWLYPVYIEYKHISKIVEKTPSHHWGPFYNMD